MNLKYIQLFMYVEYEFRIGNNIEKQKIVQKDHKRRLEVLLRRLFCYP